MKISLSQLLPKNHLGINKKLLKLKLGEVVKGEVLKVGPKRALLKIKGQRVLGQLESNLNKGDIIKLKMTGELDNKIILKMITDDNQKSNPKLKALLRNLGVKNTRATRAALSFLLKNGLPVKSETIQALTTDKQNPLGQLLQKLFGQAPSNSNKPALFQKANIQRQLEGLNLALNPDKAPEKMATDLKSLVKNLGLVQQNSEINTIQPKELISIISSIVADEGLAIDPETILASKDDPKQDLVQLLFNLADKDQPPSTKEITRLKNLLNEIKAGLENKQSHHQNLLADKRIIDKPISNKMINQIVDLLKNYRLESEDSSVEGRVKKESPLSSLLSSSINNNQKELIKSIFDKLTGIKLRQFEEGLLLHLELPLFFEEPTTATLRIEEKKQSRTESISNPLSLYLDLELAGLGQLKIMGVLEEELIDFRFFAEKEITRTLIRRYSDGFKKRLGEVGYKVNQLSISPLTEIDQEEADTNFMPGQVDFRV